MSNDEALPENVRRQIREFISTERTALFERWRLHVEPHEADRKAWVRYAVEYGQMGIRTAFLLNGGALIAVPTFAEIFSLGLWARGQGWPFSMICLFITGVVLAAIATVFAFFTMNYSQYASAKVRDRMAHLVNHDYRIALGERSERNEAELQQLMTDESRYLSRSRCLERLAILSALASLGTFAVGAGIAVYIVSGSPPS